MADPKDAKGPQLYFIHAVSPLHVGIGEGLNAVNLPTARERATGYPYLPGSSVKGILRDAAETRFGAKHEKVVAAFGPPQENAGDARGGLALTDASLLALPVRSLLATFAWVTCPYVLKRLQRDAAEAGHTIPELEKLLARSGKLQGAEMPPGSLVCMAKELLLEDLALPAGETKETGDVADWIAARLWPFADEKSESHTFFRQRFAVVADDLFGLFTRVALEIRSRVQIDPETGTAAATGPWTEEHLPAESILFGLALGRSTQYFANGRKADASGRLESGAPRAADWSIGVLAELLGEKALLRFGGKATVGLGRARMRLAVKP